MTISATIFGGLQSYRKLRWQDDFFSDMLQVELVIATGTAILSFVFWTLLNGSKESVFRGASAGIFTALLVVPLPVFGWAFKTEIVTLIQQGETGLFLLLFSTFVTAFKTALPIFASKAVLAIPLSALVGYFIARNA